MQVRNLAVDLLCADSLASLVRGSQPGHRNNGDDSGCSDPHPGETDTASPRFRRHTLLHPFAKLSAGSKPFSSRLHSALHLQTRKSIRRTGWAAANVSVESAHLFRLKLTVDVGVEF